MNNKGFAITGILYTLFILFIMTLFTIMSGLKTRTKLSEKSIEPLTNSYRTVKINYISQMQTSKIAQYDGKYIFQLNDTQTCTTYLKSSTSFNNASFIEDKNTGSPCKAEINSLVLKEVYAFETNN